MKLEGQDKFFRGLRALDIGKQKSVMRKILLKAAEPIRDTAEQLVPISDDAPHLVDHILAVSVNRVKDEAVGELRELQDDEFVVAIGPRRDLFYGFFQEYGTVAHGAQPFMRPAFDQSSDAVLKSLQDDIWAWLRERSSRSTSGRGL